MRPRLGWLSLLIFSGLLLGCRPQVESVQSDQASLPCPVFEVRSHRTFHYQFANEWMTGHLKVFGCQVDAGALREAAEGPSLDALQRLSEERPLELPFCGTKNHYPELTKEINGRVGRKLVTNACADVVADI